MPTEGRAVQHFCDLLGSAPSKTATAAIGQVAADWTGDGFGLSLDQIEKALKG